jgi:hypothetical protein
MGISVSDRYRIYASAVGQAAPNTPNNERKRRYSFVAQILTKRPISDADTRQNQATHEKTTDYRLRNQDHPEWVEASHLEKRSRVCRERSAIPVRDAFSGAPFREPAETERDEAFKLGYGS